MKHDYRKKTTWKLDEPLLEPWPGEKPLGKRGGKPSMLILIILIAILIATSIWAYRHWHNQSTISAVTSNETQTINIPLTIPSS